MPETNGDPRPIDWFESFRFLRIFRSFRMSLHWSKLLPAFCGVLLTYCAGRLLDVVWPATGRPVVSVVGEVSQHELAVFLGSAGDAEQATRSWIVALGPADQLKHIGAFALLLQHARITVNQITAAVIGARLGGVLEGFQSGFRGIVWLVSMHTGYAVIFFLVLVAIWAFFGGMVSRAAVLDVARDEKVGLREVFDFAKSHYVSFAAVPLVPIAFTFAGALALWIGGLVGLIPAVGEVLVGALFFLPLLAGLLVALLVIFGVLASPLMMPSIAADNLDALDALSTTYSYAGARAWKTVFYFLVATLYGAVCIVILKLFVMVMLWAVGLFMGASMNWGDAFAVGEGGSKVRVASKLDTLWSAPSFAEDAPFYGTFGDQELRHLSWFGRLLMKVWIYGLWAMVAACGVSLFYTASSVIYLLLRREVDLTDMEEVYLEAAGDENAGPASGPSTDADTSEAQTTS